MASDRVSDDEIMGRNKYASHQGVTRGAVAKAIKSGRITKAVVWGAGGRVAGIRWRLADELWNENTDHREALKTRKQLGPAPAAAMVQTSALPAPSFGPALAEARYEEISRVFAEIFERSMIPWAGMACGRYNVSPDVAFEMLLDGLLVLSMCTSTALRLTDDGERKLCVPWDCEACRPGTPARAKVLERIRRASADFAQDVPAGSRN